ncbi:hypothetical protein V2J09_022263 [Rumex salicifolius]
MEEEPPTPPTPAQPTSPFWLPSTSTRRHRFRPNSALLLNTGVLLILLSISAIAFLAFLTPSLLSFTQQHLFRPSSIKRGWDSLNLFLVVFAVVVCGFLGSRDGEDRPAIDDGQSSKDTTPRLVRSEQSNWYPCGYQGNVVQLRRSFKSYPDLRQENLWENDRMPRYFDDSCLGNYNSTRMTRSAESFKSQRVNDDQQNGSDEKNIEVSDLGKHTSEDSTSPPVERIPPTTSPLSLQPPAPDLSIGVEDSKQEYQSIRRRGRRTRRLAAKQAESPPTARRTRSPPPRPPPLTEVGQHGSEEEGARSTPKKRGGMTKEIISSIYHQSKRKKNQKRRSHENLQDFVHHQNPNPSFPPSPPPPPPPLPPPSIFHSLFSSKKGKAGKKSSSAPTPPPPPPRRRSSAFHANDNSTKAKTRFTPPAARNRTNLNLIDQIAGDGSESPLIPIPPPPPPPPFKFRSWKFAVEGDYVKITGSPKSGGGDSEMDESDGSTPMANGKAHPSFSCSSPDVNDKADDFIAMFRAKLELEKMNSIKQKQESRVRFSPLGPDYSPSPT